MNLSDIRNECWGIARDTALVDSDRLWTTAEMNRYINRTYRTIARETKCIKDAVTPEVCQISVTPRDWTTLTAADGMDYVWVNDPNSWLYHQNVSPYLFALHPSILQILECKWTTSQWRLTKVSVKKWQVNPWWEQVVGLSTEYATDLSNNKIALNFRNGTADTLRLQVSRLPLVDLINSSDVPEFRTHYHDYFVNGVLWQMYSKQDAETIDETKAAKYYAAFLQDIDYIKQEESILDERLNPNNSMSAFR